MQCVWVALNRTCSITKPMAMAIIKLSKQDWHWWLGHPSTNVVSNFLSSNILPLQSDPKVPMHYKSCHCNKSHKLPFGLSRFTSSKPLESISSDMWTSHITLVGGVSYYVIFVDHYTKYLWLYLMKRRSDVLPSLMQLLNWEGW